MNVPYEDAKGNIIDYYEIFSLPYDAEKAQIRSAFCRLVKEYHPDTAERHYDYGGEKIDLIIKGYKILSDEELRREYDHRLLDRKRRNDEGFYYIPKNRVKYSISLRDLLMTRLLHKRFRRKDRVFNFGQDVEIFVNQRETAKGAVAYVELPSRMYCPLCFGQDGECYVCHGVGRISSTANLEVRIPPGLVGGTVIDFDLMKIRPDRFSVFAMKSLRIKISPMGQK